MADISSIGYGHREPLKRPSSPAQDRELRRAIEAANNSGDCIINVGNGYYRPVPGDPADEAELNRYLAADLSRARAVLKRRLSMRAAFERRLENGLPADDTGAAPQSE